MTRTAVMVLARLAMWSALLSTVVIASLVGTNLLRSDYSWAPLILLFPAHVYMFVWFGFDPRMTPLRLWAWTLPVSAVYVLGWWLIWNWRAELRRHARPRRRKSN
jgi:hypothetical protein